MNNVQDYVINQYDIQTKDLLWAVHKPIDFQNLTQSRVVVASYKNFCMKIIEKIEGYGFRLNLPQSLALRQYDDADNFLVFERV